MVELKQKILTSLSKLSDRLSQCHWLTLQPLPQRFEAAPPAAATAAASKRVGQELGEAPIIIGEGGASSPPPPEFSMQTSTSTWYHSLLDHYLPSPSPLRSNPKKKKPTKTSLTHNC